MTTTLTAGAEPGSRAPTSPAAARAARAEAGEARGEPRRGEGTSPGDAPGARSATGARLLRPADWPVRRKVVAALALPVAAALAISGVRLADLVQAAGDFSRDASVSLAQQAAADLVREAGREQVAVAAQLTGTVVGDEAPGSEGGTPDGDGIPGSEVADVAAQQERTDETVAEVLERAAPFGDRNEEVRTRLRSVEGAVERVRSVREAAAADAPPEDPAAPPGGTAELVRAYADLSGAALRLGDALAGQLVEDSVQRDGAAAQALSEAARQSAVQDALVVLALTIEPGRGEASPSDLSVVTPGELEASEAARVAALSRFEDVATPAQQGALAERVSATETGRARARAFQLVLGGLRGSPLVTPPPEPAPWLAASSPATTSLEELRADIGREQVERAEALRDERLARAAAEAAVVLAALALGLLVTVALARLIVRPLGRLRREAMAIAEQRLPAAITEVRAAGPRAEVAAEAIGVRTAEEVGQAARAFDAVHQRAIDLAVDGERLRASLDEVLVSLSRRSQSLVERQLRLIDRLENEETDPDQLEQLFSLDHLAARMRRYNDNLLILAGGTATRRHHRDMPLIDVLRAATSETEQYARVAVMEGDSHLTVAAEAAPALVHLLAELLDNATSYSPPATEVVVTYDGNHRHGAVVAISDGGVGFSPDRLARVNDKLAAPPEVDDDAPRQMGLFVVARLAHEHGVRVELRGNDGAGTTASVWLPPDALAHVDHRTPPSARPDLSDGRPPPDRTSARPAGRSQEAGPGPGRASTDVPAPAADRPEPRVVPGPPPRPAARDTTPEETPLFYEVSAWFSPSRIPGPSRIPSSSRPSPGSAPGGVEPDAGRPDAGEPHPPAVPARPSRTSFASAADVGWAAVAALGDTGTTGVGLTRSGLPRRVPQAHLLPGSAGSTTVRAGPATPPGRPAPDGVPAGPASPRLTRDPEGVRGRLATLQRGVQAGRLQAGRRDRGPATADPGAGRATVQGSGDVDERRQSP